MNSGAQPAERMIRDIIECEHSYINTDHADFIGGSRAIAQVNIILWLEACNCCLFAPDQ